MDTNRPSTEIKKFLRKFIFICFVLVLADLIIGKTLHHYYFKINSGSLYDVTFPIDSTRAETLVFGSSRANHHYVPKLFENRLNTSFYNCGMDGTGLIYETALVKAIIERYKPKRILLDILPGEFSFDESDRLSRLLPYQDNPAIYPYILEKSPYERMKLLSWSYPYNSLVTSIMIRNIKKNNKEVDTKGYFELNGIMDSVNAPLSIEEHKIVQKKVLIYNDLLQCLNKLNVATYVIISPFYTEVKTFKSEKITKDLCKKYTNCHFISFLNRRDYLQNYKLFKDFTHLNKVGANKFSKEICNDINYIEKTAN